MTLQLFSRELVNEKYKRRNNELLNCIILTKY